MKLILTLLWQQAKRQPRLTAIAMTLHIVLALLWVAEPLYSSFAIDQLLKLKDGLPVDTPLILGGWSLLSVVISITDGFEKYVSWQVDNLLYIHRREEVYAHALHLDIAYHTAMKSGETVKALDDGADHLLDLQRALFVDIGPSILSASIFLVLSFLIQPILACILVIALILYLVLVVFGVKKTSTLQHDVNKIWMEAVGRAYDAATNIFSVKSNAQEQYELGLMEKSGKVAHGKQSKVNKRWALIESMNFFMMTRLLLTGIGILLYIRNLLSLGGLYFFQASFFRVLTPFEILSNLLPQWNRKVGKVRLAQNILETEISVKSPGHPVVLRDLKGEISLEDVCFAYAAKEEPAQQAEPASVAVAAPTAPRPTSDNPEEETKVVPRPEGDEEEEDVTPEEEAATETPEEATHGGEVLHGINLAIRPGEHVAFVGHSGAGKTTLAMLLCRFYDPTHGRITIDGVDLRQIDLNWWRRNVGLVLQENIMFNDSLKENIRYSRRGATMEDIRDATRRAAALDFIEQLPAKFETMIGDRGIRLSGGQRQRIAIARAILKNPKIVILDEATSALDSVTERDVQEGIKELITGRTACIIAHRLSTVRQVDRIAVFEKGRLIAAAPHAELVRTCPIYKEMVTLQSQGMLAE